MINDKIGKAASMRTAIVTLAACVFPLSFVAAQDIEAVERRLGGAVEAGELSLEQAVLMLDTLRRTLPPHEMHAREHRFEQITHEIRAAVETGKLSEQQAREKLRAVRREMFESGERHEVERHEAERHEVERHEAERRERQAKEHRFERMADEIRAAVEAGKLSEQQAEEKLRAVRREMFESGEGHEAERHEAERRERQTKGHHFERMADEIRAAVEAGKLSEQQAEEKLRAVRRKLFEDRDERSRERETHQ